MLAESMFIGMVRGGSMTRETALSVLEKMTEKLSVERPEAAAEIARFKREFTVKTAVQ